MKSLATVFFIIFLLAPFTTLGAALIQSNNTNFLHSSSTGNNYGMLSLDLRNVNQSSNALVSNCVSNGNSEVESATDPTNGYVYDLWIGCNGIGFTRSVDGGHTFEQPIMIPGTLDVGGAFSWDPAITVGKAGVVYASFMHSQVNQGGVPYISISYDHGLIFSPGVNVSTPTAQEFSDRDFVAVSTNNTIYVTWDYAPNASLVGVQCPKGGSCYYTTGDLNIVISHSINNGTTWSKPVQISPDYPFGGGVSAPLLVEPSGRIDVLYEDYTIGPNYTLGLGLNYFTYTTDGGNTWAKGIVVGNSSGYLSNKEWWIDGDLARDNSGTLYASYDTSNGTSENTWLAISNDDGLSWSNPVELSHGDNSNLNIMPGVLGAGNSSVFTAWMADYPSGWSAYFQVFSRTGAPLSKQIIVSNQSGLNGVWGGDTLGLAGLNQSEGALVSWGYGIKGLGGGNISEIFSSSVYNVSLTSDVGGTTLPAGSNNWLRYGETVSLQAIPNADYTFGGWTVDSQSLAIASPDSANTTLSVYGSGYIVAMFDASTKSESSSSLIVSTTANPPSYSFYDTLVAVIGALIILSSVFVIIRRRAKAKTI